MNRPPKKQPPAAAKATTEPEEPKPVDAAIALKPFAQAQSRRAIEALAAVMSDPTAPPAARISAATTLLTWGHGRPQGEGEWAPGNRAEPVIKLRWAASEPEPGKSRKAKRRGKQTVKAGPKPKAKPARS